MMLGARMLQAASYTPPPASYPAVVLADSPDGYWRMGDSVGSPTAADSSGNGLDLTVLSGVTFGAAGLITGDSDTAASFDGTSGATNNITLPSAVQATETWFNTTDYSTSRDFFSLYQSDASRLVFSHRTTGQLGVYSGSANSVALLSDSAVTAGAKHHVVLLHDSGSNISFMVVDGVVQSNTFSGNIFSAAGASPLMLIGGFYYAAAVTPRMKGVLDEMAVYSAGMTTTKAAAHYNAGK